MNIQSHDQVNDVLARWTDAERAGDVEGLREVLADDFTGVGPLGFTLTKTDWLDRHGPDALRYETFELTEVELRVHGAASEVAVASARLNSQGAYRGHPTPEALRVSLILHRDAGPWQLSAAHMSFIAGTAGAPPMPGQS